MDHDPLEAIAESSLQFIDVALIGLVGRTTALLASDARLLASARTRELYLPADDDWAKRTWEILARTDSILARHAIEGMLGAE